MRQPTLTSPEGTSSVQRPPFADPSRDSRARRRRPTPVAHSFSAGTIVAACLVAHMLAAAAMYSDMARDLYALFDAAPRLLVMERGLVRLTAISVFLPPIVPAALLSAVTLWLGRSRRDADVAHWLALATVPLAGDSVLRAVGVLIAPAPANIGELLELPSRFSLGPRMVLDLIGARPSPGIAYWIVVCTLASAVSACYVARALAAAESLNDDIAGLARARARARSRETGTMDLLRAGTVVAGAWIAFAFAGQVALPWATQFVLQAFG